MSFSGTVPVLHIRDLKYIHLILEASRENMIEFKLEILEDIILDKASNYVIWKYVGSSGFEFKRISHNKYWMTFLDESYIWCNIYRKFGLWRYYITMYSGHKDYGIPSFSFKRCILRAKFRTYDLELHYDK